MSCISFNNKPTHLQLKTRTSNQLFGDMQNYLTSPSTTTQNNTSASQVPVTDKSPTVQKSSKREVTAGLGATNGKRTSTGSTGQQRARTSAPPPKPAVCSAATTARQRTMQDARPAATSGHADSTSPVTATSHRQRLAELRVAPGVTNVLIGDSVARSSNQAGPGVPWGSEPEPQRLWPSHRRR